MSSENKANDTKKVRKVIGTTEDGKDIILESEVLETLPVRGPDPAKFLDIRGYVEELLDTDEKYRGVKGASGDLYNLCDLGADHGGIHGIPQIRSPKHLHLNGRANNDGEFGCRFYSKVRCLQGFPLEKYGFVVAGGCVSGLIMRKATNAIFDDVDIFYVREGGDPVHDIQVGISALERHLEQYKAADCAARNYPGRVSTCRTEKFIVYNLGFSKIQVILKRYETVWELLHNFDLGSSAVAWTGSTVVMTGLARFAITTRLNILNLRGRRSSYETRVCKYIGRGFGLALPDVSIEALACTHDNNLPFLILSDRKTLCGCAIRAHVRKSPDAPSDISEYGFVAKETSNPEKILAENVKILGGKPGILIAVGSLRDGERKERILPTVRELTSLFAVDMSSGKIPITELRELFPSLDRVSVAASLAIKSGDVGELTEQLKELSVSSRNLVADIVRGSVTFTDLGPLAKSRIESLEEQANIPFVLAPGTDQGGILGTSPAEWYGNAYAPRAGAEVGSLQE